MANNNIKPTILKKATPRMNLENKRSSEKPLMPTSIQSLLNITDGIEVVTTIPSGKVNKLYDQLKIYVDDKTTPTVRRLYFYVPGVDEWGYIDYSV